MTRYVALLRGVNVAGRMVPMADLRALAADLGLHDVATYIQTGNLLFTAGEPPDGLRLRLEAALGDRYGWPIAVALRTAAAVAEAADTCPFVPGPHEVVYVGFTVKPPDPGRLETVRVAGADGGDAATPLVDRVYVLYRHGVHGSRLSNGWLERGLGVPVTSRNLRTVRELARRVAASG